MQEVINPHCAPPAGKAEVVGQLLGRVRTLPIIQMEEKTHIVVAGGVRGVFRIVGHLHQLVYLVVGGGCSYVCG